MSFGNFPTTRPRRLRHQAKLRQLVRETKLDLNDLVLPLFIRYGTGVKNPIASMPDHYQLSIDQLESEINEITQLGISNVILFGIPEHKDEKGRSGADIDGVVQSAVKTIKQINSEMLVITDVCLCEYTDHGHCGVLNEAQDIDNDPTLEQLAQQAVSHAQAGADIVAPSGMMDGMVQAIRHGLDAEGFTHLPILSYAVKYASSFYGPFREAAEGAPQFGDRRTYQMDPANRDEALKEAALDTQEGADMLMVKPAGHYLDVIADLKSHYPYMPLAAYQVSGEYAMIQAAAQQNWLDATQIALETLTSIKRAGADFVLTYFAKAVAKALE